jgi:hypothetical protein
MKPENIQDIYELSPIQQGILFHCIYAPKSGFYFVQKLFSLNGNLNFVAFDRAWKKVVDRHPSLRTGFYWEDINKPLQVVYEKVKVAIEQQDWQGLDRVEQQKRLESFMEEDLDRGFDLSQESLMRLTLIRLSDRSYKFIWSSHFIILDGWSVMFVLKDFIQFYEAFCQDRDISLPAISPFKNHITWLQQQDSAKAEVFWRQALKGLKTPTFLKKLYVKREQGTGNREQDGLGGRFESTQDKPLIEVGDSNPWGSRGNERTTDLTSNQQSKLLPVAKAVKWSVSDHLFTCRRSLFPRPQVVDNSSNQEKRHDHQRIFLSEIKTAALTSFTRQHQITLNTLIQAAWALLISHYSGEKKVLYGYTTAGRSVDLLGSDSMVGTLVNSLPVWVEIDRHLPLLPWLKQFQKQLVEMRQYEYSPLVEIQGCTEIPRDVSFFESLVVFEKVPLLSSFKVSQGELEIEMTNLWYKTNYPLNLVVYPFEKLILEIAYHCHLFDASTIIGILQHLDILLQNIVTNPQVRLKDLSLLTPAEKKFSQMLEEEVTFDFIGNREVINS